jgi:hypothetical protein
MLLKPHSNPQLEPCGLREKKVDATLPSTFDNAFV